MNYLMNEQGQFFEFAAHKAPVFKELKNKDWLIWGYSSEYDDREWNNRQPDYYELLYNSSSKHRAIINRKVLFICGKGLTVTDRSLSPQEEVEAKAFAFKLNDSELVKKLALNLTKIGGFCYEVISDKAKKKIEPYYVNIKNVRRSKVEYDEQGRELDPVYYYTKDWSTRKPEENPDFTIFHEWKWDGQIDSNKRYLVYYSEDEENLYPIPEYTAAVPYIAADYEISNFVYNNVRNGFSAGWLVNFFNGEPNEEEKQVVANYWKAKLHGSDQSGEPVLSFQDNGVPGVDITPLSPNGQDDRFINLNKQIREEIFSGHTVDPVVVGLEGNNGFNNNADEKRTAIEDFQNYYVSGKQFILEQHINAIRSYNEIKGNLTIQRLDPIAEQVSEQELAQILTEDERRERAGYAPKTDDQKTTTVVETEKQFSKDDLMVAFLSGCGISDEELEVIDEREVSFNSIEEAEKYKFLSASALALLGIILDNPGIELAALAELMKRSVEEVRVLQNELKEDGLLDDNGTPTSKGEDKAGGEVFVVYKYVKRLEASGPDVIDGTRDFCRNLIRLSKVEKMNWTLDEIKRMNNDTRLDPFRSGGGFWNKDGTIKNHCRHTWKMRVVRRR